MTSVLWLAKTQAGSFGAGGSEDGDALQRVPRIVTGRVDDAVVVVGVDQSGESLRRRVVAGGTGSDLCGDVEAVVLVCATRIRMRDVEQPKVAQR